MSDPTMKRSPSSTTGGRTITVFSHLLGRGQAMHRFLLACSFGLALALAMPWPGSSKDTRHPELVRQIQTTARMHEVSVYISLYREDHPGEDPPNLAALTKAYSMPAATAVDAWNRPLYYYATGGRYVLISFGRSGVPRAQRSEPGAVSPMEPDWDENIVMIDGEWAQTPFGVGR
jgi:hypothetical protein